jgi:hypothetical protein
MTVRLADLRDARLPDLSEEDEAESAEARVQEKQQDGR